ncbi:unknown [Salmonella phage FelixO1]|uniref:Uncharacterized protein n=1 Tax=Salmonella phage Felix O1 (isolate Felix O1-VT1) TaxID=1283336 RepID=Q6KGB0_BPFO1|nr:unknown [Salmonella phage FelixO1]
MIFKHIFFNYKQPTNIMLRQRNDDCNHALVKIFFYLNLSIAFHEEHSIEPINLCQTLFLKFI